MLSSYDDLSPSASWQKLFGGANEHNNVVNTFRKKIAAAQKSKTWYL